MTVKPIDQERRRVLCTAILSGDRDTADCARHDLAVLYREAGYPTLARIVETAKDGGRIHARAILEGGS
jgi:hypothetical protein